MAQVDFLSIGNALAARYGPLVVTPPTGESPIQRVGLSSLTLGTSSGVDRPVVLSRFPCVLVLPAGGTFTTGAGERAGHHDWLIRFFYRLFPDSTKHPAPLHAWLSQLVNLPHLTDAQLVVSTVPLVSYVRVDAWRIPEQGLTYAGTVYEGIELTVHTLTNEGWTPTAS